jgi:hypothetical protein
MDGTQIAKLTASNGGGALGFSVAIAGNTVVAGERGTGTPAFLFVEPAGGWADMTETAQLTASDQAQLFFGDSVAISGNTAVVGAPPNQSIPDNADPGGAYVFLKPPGGWVNMTETQKLISLDGEPNNGFGVSAAMTSSALVVGDPGPTTAGGEIEKGAAYVFAPAQLSFSRFAGNLLIDPDAGVFYLSGGFKLGPGASINPATEPVTFSVGNYSAKLPPGSFVKYKTGYVYQRTVNHIFLCIFIKFTSTPGAYQLLANRKGGTLTNSTSPMPVILAIGNDSGTAQMNAKFD